MLEKRDSKSLEGVVTRSAILTERLKNALQDNKSQSMDEGIFNEKVAKLRPKDANGGGGAEATDSTTNPSNSSEVRPICPTR